MAFATRPPASRAGQHPGAPVRHSRSRGARSQARRPLRQVRAGAPRGPRHGKARLPREHLAARQSAQARHRRRNHFRPVA
eukprot:7945809-Lingulodinium_polyedra.AAC.1